MLFASDLIEHDGGDLRDLPLIDRKRRLAELIGKAKRAVTRDGQTAFPKNWSLAQYASRSQRERARKTPSKSDAPPAVDEGLKTDALPGVDVVVARHPAQAGVVAAEFGERCRAGNGIRHVIVAAVGMRDGVPANRACATFKPYDLALKAIIARQDDAATVQER